MGKAQMYKYYFYFFLNQRCVLWPAPDFDGIRKKKKRIDRYLTNLFSVKTFNIIPSRYALCIVSLSFKYMVPPHCSRAKAYFGHISLLCSPRIPYCSLALPTLLPRCSSLYSALMTLILLLRLLTSLLLHFKGPCSLFRSRAVILYPKFGIYL